MANELSNSEYMTRVEKKIARDTIKTIRSMGAIAHFDGETNEYRVNIRSNHEATAYYTDYAEDAIATAKVMLRAGGIMADMQTFFNTAADAVIGMEVES